MLDNRSQSPESEVERDLGPDSHPFCCENIEPCIGDKLRKFYMAIGKKVGSHYEDGPFNKMCCFAAWSPSFLPHKVIPTPRILEDSEFIIEFRPYTVDSETPTRSASRWFVPGGAIKEQFNELFGAFSIGSFEKTELGDGEVWFKCEKTEHEDYRFCLTFWKKIATAS